MIYRPKWLKFYSLSVKTLGRWGALNRAWRSVVIRRWWKHKGFRWWDQCEQISGKEGEQRRYVWWGEKNCLLEQHFSIIHSTLNEYLLWETTMQHKGLQRWIKWRVLLLRGPRPIWEKSVLTPLYTSSIPRRFSQMMSWWEFLVPA